jgi:hypothetical protein
MINLRDLKSHNKTVNANKSRLNNSTFLSNWLYISRIHSINGSPETNTTPFYSWQTKINISAAAARVRYLLLLLHISTFMADHDHLLSFTDHRMEWKPIIFFIANVYIYIYMYTYVHYNKRCLCALNDFIEFWVNLLVIMKRT